MALPFATCAFSRFSSVTSDVRSSTYHIHHPSLFIIRRWTSICSQKWLPFHLCCSPPYLLFWEISKWKLQKLFEHQNLRGSTPLEATRKNNRRWLWNMFFWVQWCTHGWFPCSSCDGLVSCKHISGLCLLTVRSTHMAHSRSNNQAQEPMDNLG
jgi:hypothetical protein